MSILGPADAVEHAVLETGTIVASLVGDHITHLGEATYQVLLDHDVGPRLDATVAQPERQAGALGQIRIERDGSGDGDWSGCGGQGVRHHLSRQS